MPDHMAHAHEAPGRDVGPFLKTALDDIVQDVLLYGQYPEKGRPEVSLAEFLYEDFYRGDHIRMVSDLQTAVLQESFDHDIRSRWEEALERRLEGSEIVLERATELAWEDE